MHGAHGRALVYTSLLWAGPLKSSVSHKIHGLRSSGATDDWVINQLSSSWLSPIWLQTKNIGTHNIMCLHVCMHAWAYLEGGRGPPPIAQEILLCLSTGSLIYERIDQNCTTVAPKALFWGVWCNAAVLSRRRDDDKFISNNQKFSGAPSADPSPGGDSRS